MSEPSDVSETQTSQNTGSVYVLRSGSSNLFKIGRTKGSVDKRIKQLNTGNPHSLVVFDVIETEEASHCETYLHQRLRTVKHFGSGGTEFFEITPDELISILQDARTFLNEYISARRTADTYKAAQSEDRIIEPSDELQNEYRRLLEIREQVDMLKFEQELIEYRIKAALGMASELQGIATWKTSLVMRFDQDSFRQSNPDLHTQYLKQHTQRTFKLVQK